jgi:hypothetical protein
LVDSNEGLWYHVGIFNERKEKEMFIVTYVDYSDSSDFHSRVLGVYSSRDEAEAEIRADMAGTSNYYGDTEIVDNDKFEVWKEIGTVGCVWDVHEIDEFGTNDFEEHGSRP